MKKKRLNTLKLLVCWLICMAYLASCVSENEEDLFEGNLSNCNTANISYSTDIIPILQQNCYSCHNQISATAGVVLEGYNALKFWVDNGKLVGVITHAQGFPPMPQGAPKLSACNIKKIQEWITKGALEN